MWILLGAVLAAGPIPAPFTSEEASFAVAVPGVPIYDNVTVPTSEGPQVRHVFHGGDNDVTFFITHTCTPPPTLPADPQKALDLGRDGGLQMAGATLVSEKRV
jgi:hypothetical protein